MTVFKKILIALDGSPLAEQSLGAVDAILGGQGAELSLLRVVPPLGSDPDLAEELASAQRYLEGQSLDRSTCTVLVRPSDDPAEQILEESAGHDLIALSTHGRGGLKRWALGSVAERVLRRAEVPVLLNSARGEQPAAPSRIERILVPLDGSERSNAVVTLAGALAAALDAELLLFTSCYVDPTDNPLAYSRLMTAERQRAEANLSQQLQALEAGGVRVRSEINSDYPAEAILDLIQSSASDLVVMSTHGRSGLKRWFLGSVAEKIVRASPRPVLLLRDRPED